MPSSNDELDVDPLMPLTEEVVDRWSALAIGFRLQQEMLREVQDPAPTSNFEQANALYPTEKVSDWCRDYLAAALEHALFWADYTQGASIMGTDPDETEAIWRAASGSAHGRRWPAHVLQRIIPGEE